MRLVALSLFAVFLAGCSGGSGIQAFLVTPADIPEDCRYATEEDYQFFNEVRDDYGWATNPGRFDAGAAFDLEGDQEPQYASLAILHCEELGNVFSWVMAFADGDIAATVADEMADCGENWESPTYVRGNIVGQFEVDDGVDGVEDHIAQRLANRLQLSHWCDLE